MKAPAGSDRPAREGTLFRYYRIRKEDSVAGSHRPDANDSRMAARLLPVEA
jgi:hypothetical protein